MSTRGRLSLKDIGLFMCVCVLLFGCASPQEQTVLPSVTPVLDGGVKISAQIQITLNNYNTALLNNDKALFMSTIDQNNSAIRESFSSSFDFMESSGFPQSVKLGMTVIDIEQNDDDLVLAHVRRDRDGWQADWFFRKSGDNWVISEPTATEAGTFHTSIIGNYTFVTFPIADYVNEKIASLMPAAEERVRLVLGQAPDVMVDVTIYPFILSSPLGTALVSSWDIDPYSVTANHIYVISPESCCFGFYDPQAGWEPDFEIVLAHELARVVYVRNFENPGRGVDWMFEGLAEYVAGFDQMPDVIDAVQNNTVIPIIDTSSATMKVDLAHFENLDNPWLASGLSESLVTFIVEEYGGLGTFWTLAGAYDETKDMQSAIQNTLGISYEQFDSEWREWLKDNYINR